VQYTPMVNNYYRLIGSLPYKSWYNVRALCVNTETYFAYLQNSGLWRVIRSFAAVLRLLIMSTYIVTYFEQEDS